MEQVWTREVIAWGVDRYAPTLDSETREQFLAYLAEQWLDEPMEVWHDLSREWVRFITGRVA